MKHLTAKELKKVYIEFFKTKGHKEIPSASLIPDEDATVLFTTAGMQPLIPYILGEQHPLGNRIVDVQKCLRTQDIEEVGDTRHTTFFEMLGNWSFNDYFKKEAITWSYEFLTKVLEIDKNKLAVTCFGGDKIGNTFVEKDKESYEIWKNLGISENRIAFLGKDDNWWGLAEGGPCGPDTEIFYWVSDDPVPEKFNPNDERWVEIWNNVFMQYNFKDGKISSLGRHAVDTGMGVERVTMLLQNKKTIFDTELFQPIFQKISEISNTKPEDNIKAYRIIADHMRAATFILGDEKDIVPSNKDQGYILRRFIRRTLRYGMLLGIKENFCNKIAEVIINQYKDEYPLLEKKKNFIFENLEKEEEKFRKTLEKGLREFEKLAKRDLSGKDAFLLYQSYGFPIELTIELADEKGIKVDLKGFYEEYEKHKALSRQGAEKKFKGGLADTSQETVKLHTATHILNEALRRILDKNIKQKGSNITPERLRFDFNFPRKLTPEEIKAVEDEVNRVINLGLEVIKKEMPLEEALKLGAQAEFGARYPPIVSVYFIGDYSKEICRGPHVKNTKELGKFKIIKEESSAAGIRRIKAKLL